jgi:Zn-dependent peptidase ImmA (M78 family)
MKQGVPLNPETLRWARESANIMIDEVADRMGKESDVIEAWENGTGSPTYVQLEKLAYEVYKRPMAVFFFPQPPEEVTPQRSFRTLPESELERLPAAFLRIFRQAQAMQMNLEELNDGVNPAGRKVFRDFSLAAGDNAPRVAGELRAYLGVSLESQVAWKDHDVALKQWRRTLEENGVFVFKEAFRCDDVSGFCLYDPEFPIIYVNDSMSRARQIFTLFHELTHLLLKTGGIDKTTDAFLTRMRGANKRKEVLCNRVASEFLVPGSDFRAHIRNVGVEDKSVETLAGRYKVSREVILRRCLDMQLVGQDYYERKAVEWAKEARRARRGTSGGNYYNKAVSYLGETYLSLVFKKHYQNRFSREQLADYLTVKVRNIPSLESAFLGRG